MVHCDTTLCTNPVGHDAMYSAAANFDGGELELRASYSARGPDRPEGQGTPLQPHLPSSVGCHAGSLCDGKLHASSPGGKKLHDGSLTAKHTHVSEAGGEVSVGHVPKLSEYVGYDPSGALCYLGLNRPSAIVNGGDNSKCVMAATLIQAMSHVPELSEYEGSDTSGAFCYMGPNRPSFLMAATTLLYSILYAVPRPIQRNRVQYYW